MPGKRGRKSRHEGLLTADQQGILHQYKIKTRIDNEKYMREHPEVEVLIGDFVRAIILAGPSDVRQFAADYFATLMPPDLRVAEDQ